MKTKVVICDIDGVVLTCPYFNTVDDFYQNIESCVPVDWAVHLIQGLYEQGIKILFLTARDSKCRGITEHQLKQCFDFPIHLYMRIHNDTRPDFVIKEEFIYEFEEKYDILFCIDDNKFNCDMYNSHNLISLWVR